MGPARDLTFCGIMYCDSFRGPNPTRPVPAKQSILYIRIGVEG